MVIYKTKQQRIVDYLCAQHFIPTIPVVIVDDTELGGMWAYFDADNYRITISKHVSLPSLLHEWIHYAIELLRNAENLEEAICDWSPVGIQDEIPRKHTMLKMLSKKMPVDDDEASTRSENESAGVTSEEV